MTQIFKLTTTSSIYTSDFYPRGSVFILGCTLGLVPYQTYSKWPYQMCCVLSGEVCTYFTAFVQIASVATSSAVHIMCVRLRRGNIVDRTISYVLYSMLLTSFDTGIYKIASMLCTCMFILQVKFEVSVFFFQSAHPVLFCLFGMHISEMSIRQISMRPVSRIYRRS